MVGAESEEPGINRKGNTVWVHYHHVGIDLKSVILCIVLGCLAPEWPGYGSAWAALSMDLDEICKLAHKPFRLSLVVDCNVFAKCNNQVVICVPRMIIMVPKKCRASDL